MSRPQNENDPPREDAAASETRTPARTPTRRVVAISGNKIWVSEPVAIALICALLVPLVYITVIILQNEHLIHEANGQLAALRAEKISATRELESMREKDRLVRLLNEVVGDRAKQETVYKLADLIYTNSRQYGYTPELLLAVIAVESRFNPQALGRYRGGSLSGALGLMQIKYPTALEVAKSLGISGLKRSDLLEPEMNVLLGTAYLTILIARFQSFKLGIMAYNLGPGTVRRTLASSRQLPTQYYEKVLKQYYRLKALGEKMEAETENL